MEDSSLYRDLSLREPTHRERTASYVAFVVLGIFCLSMLISLGIGTFLLTRSATPLSQEAVEASLAYLKSVGGTFTPLLGFILGYYFTKKEV